MSRPTGSHRNGTPFGRRTAEPFRPRELVDALLICPAGRARDTYAELLTAEGYRVRTVDSIPLAEASMRRQPAEIVFMPSADTQASSRSWRRALDESPIPIVLLGAGWTDRVRAAAPYAPRSTRLATL